MSELPERTSRLGRLLAYLECDVDNLALRMDGNRPVSTVSSAA